MDYFQNNISVQESFINSGIIFNLKNNDNNKEFSQYAYFEKRK